MSVTQGDVLAIAVTVPLLILLAAFVTRSRIGKAMRATAQDPEAARLMGINVDTTISFTFLLGGLMAGAAGLIYALYQTTIWFFQGFTAGPDRLHGRGHGGHREPPGRGPRRGDHRLHPADLRQPHRRRVDARDRVRLPGADHGLQAPGAARESRRGRPDEPGRRSTATAISRIAVAAARLSRCVLPFFFGQPSPFMDDAVTALAYVVMALGLNIVVGFAGLLDLGYVAFFAIGAYTIGWLASGFADRVNGGKGIHVGVSELRRRTCPASTSTSCSCSSRR